MRMLVLLPVAIFTLFFLVVGVSSPHQSGKPQSSPSTSPLPALPENSNPSIHLQMSHWFGVAMWLLLPVCAILPLSAGWANIRRKVLAVCAMLVAVFGTLVVTLLMSFTGYMSGKMERPPYEQATDSLRRMKALHIVGFPILWSLSIILLWSISIRLAGRIGQSSSGSQAPSPM